MMAPDCPAFDALPLPALVLDKDDRIVAMNDAAENWLNISRRSVLGHRLTDDAVCARLRMTPTPVELIAQTRAQQGASAHLRMRFELSDRAGGFLPRFGDLHLGVAPRELPGGVIALITPTDQNRHLSPGQAARHAARQAIGMAEMLAHEIKNPLAGIQGAAQLLSMSTPAEDRPLTDLIVAESRRIVALLDHVGRFGDTSPPRLAPVNLHELLERARCSAELGFARDIRLVTDYDPSLPDALGDADQLMQVALNLLRNAAEAIGRGPGEGGTIRIRSYYDSGVRAPAEEGAGGQPLPLQIEIEDDGPGIPDAIAGQIFEPFVSGRENGTGLGLALVSKIITDHGGWLGLESRPGRTIFQISLPKA